jgi:hypothetical protein
MVLMQLAPCLSMHAIVQWFPYHYLAPSVATSIGSILSTTIRLEHGSFWKTTLQSKLVMICGTKNTYISQHVHFNVKTLKNYQWMSIGIHWLLFSGFKVGYFLMVI